MKKSAVISDCGKYRYELRRIWGETKSLVAFIGLNPSTADAEKDDATIRRCINFAKDWGYGGIIMLNLFAFRATDPKTMKAEIHPIGLENDEYIKKGIEAAALTVAAWGNHGEHHNRGDVVRYSSYFFVLALTKQGYPAHPLYLKKTLKPKPWL